MYLGLSTLHPHHLSRCTAGSVAMLMLLGRAGVSLEGQMAHELACAHEEWSRSLQGEDLWVLREDHLKCAG